MATLDEIIASTSRVQNNDPALSNNMNSLVVSLDNTLEVLENTTRELTPQNNESFFIQNAVIQNAVIQNLPNIVNPIPNNVFRDREDFENRNSNANTNTNTKLLPFLTKISDYFLKPTKYGTLGNTLRGGSSSFLLSAIGLGDVDNIFRLSEKFANADLSFKSIKDRIVKSNDFLISTVKQINPFKQQETQEIENENEENNRRRNERENFESFRQSTKKEDVAVAIVGAILTGIGILSGVIAGKLTGLSNFGSIFKESILKGFNVLGDIIKASNKFLIDSTIKTLNIFGDLNKNIKDKIIKIPNFINDKFKSLEPFFNAIGEKLGKGKNFFSNTLVKGSEIGKTIFTGTKNILKNSGNAIMKTPYLGKALKLGINLGRSPLQTLLNTTNFISGELNADKILKKDIKDVSTSDRYEAGGLNSLTELLNVPNQLSFGYIPKTVENPLVLKETVSNTFDDFFNNTTNRYEPPQDNNLAKTTSFKALNLAKIAKNNIYGDSLGQCYSYVWGAIKKSGLGENIGDDLDNKFAGKYNELAYQFSDYANTALGKSKLWQVPVNLNDKNLGLQAGDIIVLDKGWNGKSTAGHIEIVGTPDEKGNLSAYSDYMDKNLSDAKKGIKNNKLKGVYRIKEAYNNSNSLNKTKIVKQTPLKNMDNKKIDNMSFNQIEKEYGATFKTGVIEKTASFNIKNQTRKEPISNINKLEENSNKSDNGNLDSFFTSQKEFSQSILSAISQSNNSNNSNPSFSSTFVNDPFLAIIQSWL